MKKYGRIVIVIPVVIVVAGILAWFISDNGTQQHKPETSHIDRNVNKHKPVKSRKTGNFISAVNEARSRVEDEDTQKKGMDREEQKQYLIRMLAQAEGIDSDNPSEDDLSPEIQKLVNDPDPDMEKYRGLLEQKKRENAERLDQMKEQ